MVIPESLSFTFGMSGCDWDGPNSTLRSAVKENCTEYRYTMQYKEYHLSYIVSYHHWYLMGVYWGCIVGSYGFFEGQEQCLHSRLGSVIVFPLVVLGFSKYQTCLIFHQPSTTQNPHRGAVHLETILFCLSMSCCSHFPSCPILLPSCQEALADLS